MKAAIGHQASDRQRPTEKKRERSNARWGRMEHIDRKLDLGNISSTACNPVNFCQTHVLGKCKHISGFMITLSLFNNVKIRYLKSKSVSSVVHDNVNMPREHTADSEPKPH